MPTLISRLCKSIADTVSVRSIDTEFAFGSHTTPTQQEQLPKRPLAVISNSLDFKLSTLSRRL